MWQQAVLLLTRGSDPKSTLPVGDRGPCLIQCYLGPLVSLQNDISFHPGCKSVTDDIHTGGRPCYGNGGITFRDAA